MDDLSRKRALKEPPIGLSDDPAATAAERMHSGWIYKHHRIYTTPDEQIRVEAWGKENKCVIMRFPNRIVYFSFRHHKIVELPGLNSG